MPVLEDLCPTCGGPSSPTPAQAGTAAARSSPSGRNTSASTIWTICRRIGSLAGDPRGQAGPHFDPHAEPRSEVYMAELLAQLIPLAIAAALSTVPITITIVVLLSDRRSAIALPFMSGWVIGTAAGLTLATLAAHALPARQRHVGSFIANFEILVGGALVALGLVAA